MLAEALSYGRQPHSTEMGSSEVIITQLPDLQDKVIYFHRFLQMTLLHSFNCIFVAGHQLSPTYITCRRTHFETL